MNRSIWMILGIAAMVMAFGCKEKKSEQVGGEEYGKTVETPDLQRQAPDLQQEPAVDITAERNEYIQGVEQRLAELDHRIQELENTANERAVDLRQRLAQERQELNETLMQARQASAEEWQRTRQTLDQAMDRVQRAYDEAAAALSDSGQEK